jgi:hypothetical protein
MDDAPLAEIVLQPLTPRCDDTTRTSVWNVFGKLVPRLEIVFLTQMVIIYVVIVVALVNLSRNQGDGQAGKVWIALLSSCLGYMLPNPKLEGLK